MLSLLFGSELLFFYFCLFLYSVGGKVEGGGGGDGGVGGVVGVGVVLVGLVFFLKKLF